MNYIDYTKTTWVNNITPVNEVNMNHIESGIENATLTINAIIDVLKETPVRLIYTASQNPTASDIKTFVDNYLASKGILTPTDSDYNSVSVKINGTNHIWNYYANDGTYKDDGLDTVTQFTNSVAGIIRGTNIDGYVYAENDGTGSVYGWNALKTRVSNVETTLDLKENASNKVTSLSSSSTDIQYPSAKAVYDFIKDEPNLIETSWSALKTLRDNSKLIPGRFYRITDYECTTTTANTSSAGHVFDIIVLALENNKLSEEAFAAHHSGDTYFANSKLEAWKLWYCLDNDTNRFAWALAPVEEHLVHSNYSYFRDSQYDGVNGNYCWRYIDLYIFTDTLDAPTVGSLWQLMGSNWIKMNDSVSVNYFPMSVGGKGVIYRMIDEFNNDCPYDFKNVLFTLSGKYTNAYTFSYTESSTIKDASLLANKKCYSNIMKEYINSNKQQLNSNVFYSTSTTFDCNSNTFGTNCRYNTFGNYCQYNTFGNGCRINTFGDSCEINTFGTNCLNNTFGDSCRINTFGDSCEINTFGTNCLNNTFGNVCGVSTFGNYCQYNTFGNGCQYNTFGDSSSAIDYCRYNIVDNGCSYLYINGNGTASSSNQLQNVHIHSGVQGASSQNPKTITETRNNSYCTDYYPVGSITKEA